MKLKTTPQGRTFLKWLRDTRVSNGMTMRDVALRLKVPHSWIGKVEMGDRRLDLQEYIKLCRILGADAPTGLKVLGWVKAVKENRG